MKSWLVSISIIFSYGFAFSAPVEAESKDYSCHQESFDQIPFKYCIRHVDRTQTQDVVYFFHGLNGNEETWFTQFLGTKMIQGYWNRKGYKPTVITVSFGTSWLLVNSKRVGLLSLFVNRIMPFLEGQVGGLQNGRRMLIGQSMGGFNAVQASLQHPELFTKVALLCPALTTLGPFASEEEITDYIRRNKADPALIAEMLQITRKAFESQEDWELHDPMKLISQKTLTSRPRFHISIGVTDEYGFFEGSWVFTRNGFKNLFFFDWMPVIGGHCNFSRTSASKFIMGE